MRLFRHTMAIIVVINLSVISNAFALDLYVDTKTKQIFAEPGPGRVHMGTYEKSGQASAKTETPKIPAVPSQTIAESSKNTEVTESAPAHEYQRAEAGDKPKGDRLTRLREKAEKEQLKNQVSVLDECVKEVEKIHGNFDDRGLHWSTKDGNFSVSLNGRIQPASQYNFINEPDPAFGTNTPNELNSGMNIRRARLGVEGTFYKIMHWYDLSVQMHR